jgi:hypothetical protein
MECDHKYVFLSNDSFYRENGRYAYLYTSINYFFCEKCLAEKPIKKEVNIQDYMRDAIPDWARSITKKVQ